MINLKIIKKNTLFELYIKSVFWNYEPTTNGAENLLKKKNKVVKCTIFHSESKSVCDNS